MQERYYISNYRQLNYLFKISFRLSKTSITKLCIADAMSGESPHRGPSMRKAFQYHIVIIETERLQFIYRRRLLYSEISVWVLYRLIPFSLALSPNLSGNYLKFKLGSLLISPGQNGLPFRRRHFQMHFHQWRIMYFHSNFTDVCCLRSNWQ